MNSIAAFGQGKLMDNWEEELSKTEGQERVELMVELSKELSRVNLPKAESLALEGIALAKQLGDSLSMHRIEANLGDIYYKLHELDQAFEWTQKSLNFFEQKKTLEFDKAKLQLALASQYIRKREYAKVDSLFLECEAYFRSTDNLLWQSIIQGKRGLLFFYKKEYIKALNYYGDALKIGKLSGDTENIALQMSGIGIIKLQQGLYPEALEFLLDVVSMECSDYIKSTAYNALGELYRNLEDWEPAINWTQKAVEFKRKLGLECSISYSLYNLGVIHKKQLNYGEGLKYYKQCLALERKCGLSTVNTLGAIGNIYNLLGESDKANEYYDEQMELAISNNDWQGMWYVHYNKGSYAFRAERYEDALKHLLESYQIANEKRSLKFLVQSNAMLANTYEELGKDEKVKFHEKQYYLYKDSLSGFEKARKIGALEQKHLTQLQKDSLALVNQKDTVINQNNGFSNKTKIVIGLSLLALLVFLYFLFSKKEKEAIPVETKPLEETKLDRYFEEIFIRLDQNKTAIETAINPSSSNSATPINDMAEFLKTNLSTPSDWSSFEFYFQKVHKDFFKNIKSAYPNISINELNMCALIKLNLRSKDISQIMGISPASVRKAQNRLSKKLKFSLDENLRDFILKL